MKNRGANPFLILINLPVRHTRYGDPPKAGEEQAPLGAEQGPQGGYAGAEGSALNGGEIRS